MKSFFKKEIIIIIIILFVGLFLRSIYYSENLNFSTDQALFATKSLEIWRNKAVELIGPSISFKYIGRELFQGSLTYYFQLLFLLPANFDPHIASYIFTVFAVCMIVPLFYGVKMLTNRNSAIVVSLIYALTPLFIDYSRFLWNPVFQFSLTPFLILCMGLFKEKKKIIYLFLAGFCAGGLLLFHYQFVIIIIGLLIYYFIVQKIPLKKALFFLIGVGLGFSPILLFELRNNFYNTQTLLLYLQNLDKVFSHGAAGSLNIHYFLSILLFVSIIGAAFIKDKIKMQHILLLFIILLIIDSIRYIQKPTHAFGMKENWNYLYEKQTYDIITNQNIQNYNVVNLGYDTTATVQKYLMKKNNRSINYDDYYNNEYLFVITNRKDYMSDPAYEINTFKPSKVIKEWELNNTFNLFLLKRIKQK